MTNDELLGLLREARDAILEWQKEHSCCHGASDGVLEKIYAALGEEWQPSKRPNQYQGLIDRAYGRGKPFEPPEEWAADFEIWKS